MSAILTDMISRAARAYSSAAVSRRRLLRTAAAAVASMAGASMFGPRPAGAGGNVIPNPIPGGFPAGPGVVFHAYGPGPGNLNADPSTITDFNGSVGLAYLNGTVTRTNLRTGEV